MEERLRHVARGPFHVAPIFVESASGAWVTDVDGNRLLDFASGIGVVNVGHCPPEVVSQINAQSSRFLHTSFNVLPYEGYVRVAQKLNEKTPGKFPKKTFLANSGAEAVENAVKIARSFTGRESIICFDHAFHGRTYMALSLTAKEKPYKQGFAPYCEGVFRSPFPYAYRWPGAGAESDVSVECFEAFRKSVGNAGGANKIAAVIIEPVLGEGGFVPAPKEFLSLLHGYCSENGIVLIADEIQTGFGRTGTFFACEQLDFTPDILISAKGIAGGLPLSAVTGRAEIMDAPGEGAIGGTFGGNPVACAAALAVFSILEKSLLSHSREIGTALEARMKTWPELSPHIGDVRGIGPMRAIELVADRKTKEPHPELTKKIIHYCCERGVILMSAGSYGNVVRFLFPLTVKMDELNEGLKIIDSSLSSLK
jgi:4-aminobutyrate aminotransferase / (S)-3-amino-2-methylpropionate transaminase / 5-aminovalerate transaminase